MNDNNKNENLGSLLVILSAIAFGLMPLVTKIAYSHGCNAYSAAFWRFIFAGLILSGIIAVVPGYHIRVRFCELRKIFLLSIPFSLTCLLLYTSYNYIGCGLATTLHFTYPASVIIIMLVFFRQKPSLRQTACTIACIAGVIALYKPDGKTAAAGIILAVLSGIVYSVYIVFLSKSGLRSIPVPVLAFWLSVFASAETAVIFLPSGLLRVRSIDPAGWAALAALAVLASVIALVLFQKGLFLCGEVKASLLSTFEPLTGIFAGIIAFNEKLTIMEGAGIICILFSVIILVVKKSKV
ncbi:MAG: DMT family transporter [Oscillospiraceae bacterium]|nr:DMT family transporter [Oscillospiraceae bacterium]